MWPKIGDDDSDSVYSPIHFFIMAHIPALILLACIPIGAVAQHCVPDPDLPDSINGVFPMPYHATSNPGGGIRDTACVGAGYAFVLTAIVGEVFTLGTTTLPLDSLWLDKKTAVEGLPSGLSYSCYPENCVFSKNSRGCVVLEGTPSEGTQGVHQLKISGKLYANGSKFGLPLSFPDPNIAPGEYALVVARASEPPCVMGMGPTKDQGGLRVYPNPFAHEVRVKIDQKASIRICSLAGATLYSQDLPAGVSAIPLGHLQAGVYLLEATTGNDVKNMKINKI
ncbi:MAG: T9SS type A sorting domain-containing protein [Bacteroidetes bacterium]|jgi:hypothetical protein|nr:T9SS type A sorting domain-containing protein [Bacteroidota bacterium]